MPEQLRTSDDGRALTITAADVPLATYVYLPDAPAVEAPKPYFHPLRTTSGAPVTNYRPWDHRWHKGVQMTLSHVTEVETGVGQNFWGGPTFEADAPGNGYVWRDNLGRQDHVVFDKVMAGDAVEVAERLDWVTSTDDRWFAEERTVRLSNVDLARGLWVLDFATTLTNTHSGALRIGSPTTHGRPRAGYTGFFWRGPRAWTDAPIIAADGTDGETVMGHRADWVAMAGQHDGRDGGATVLLYAGRSSAAVPLTWFARTEMFAALNPSVAFHDEFDLAPGKTLVLTHRLVVIDRALDRAGLAPLAEEFTP
ncbi:MAG: hypothetical protein JWR52_3397 [Marmoricola sp.]|nr:hypothetical protein [Marmoricola sp.]